MALLPVLVLMFYFTASGHFGYTPDDTFIYLQFAKNLVHGNGVAFNAGDPTYGVTSPLWLFVIALGGVLRIDLAVAAKAIDLLMASGAVILFYLAAYELIRDMVVAMLATLTFSLNIWLLRWAGSGMETSCSVLLVLAAFVFCLRNEYLLSVVMAALLALVRPEAVLFVFFIAADIFVNSHDKRSAAGLTMKLAVVYAAILAPWLVYAYINFGTIIPNTALAKSPSGMGLARVEGGIWNIGSIVAASDGVVVVGLLSCGVLLWRKLRTATKEDRFFYFRQSLVGLGWAAALPVLYLLRNVTVVSRYMLLVTPFLVLVAYLYLYGTLMRSRFQRFAYAGVIIFAGLTVVQSQVTYRLIVAPGIEAFESGMNTSLVSIGHWLKEHTRPDEGVLAWDIGAVGYFSDRRICDAAGLVTPGLIPYVREGAELKQIADERLYAPYCTVNYVVHRAEEPNALAANPSLVPLFSKPFYRIGLLKMRQDYYTVYQVASADIHLKEAQ